MKKFEYKVLTFGYGMIPDEQRLNELGQSGWELTGMIVDSEKKYHPMEEKPSPCKWSGSFKTARYTLTLRATRGTCGK